MTHLTRIVRRRRAARGLALLLVLGVVAVVSILSWSMLSSASMRAQVEATTADGVDASYLAESGISYAMYYLMYPAKSPVTVRQGTYNSYFPGQAGLTMWSDARGTVDTSVSNTGDGMFSIASSSTVNGIKRTLIADAAYNYDTYKVTHALAVNNTGAFTIPLNMTVTGPVVNRGAVVNLGLGSSGNGALTPAGANVTPPSTELTLYAETYNTLDGSSDGHGNGGSGNGNNGTKDRTYTYDGKTYHAEPIGSSTFPTTLVTSNPTLNPMNVWYTENDLTINGATFTGTIVVRNSKRLTVLGLNAITSKAADMPALICGSLDMKQSTVASRLTVNGVAWLNSGITNSGFLTNTGYLKVTGALLFGGSAPSVDATMSSPITVTYATTAAKIPRMSTVRTLKGVAITGWRQGTN